MQHSLFLHTEKGKPKYNERPFIREKWLSLCGPRSTSELKVGPGQRAMRPVLPPSSLAKYPLGDLQIWPPKQRRHVAVYDRASEKRERMERPFKKRDPGNLASDFRFILLVKALKNNGCGIFM